MRKTWHVLGMLAWIVETVATSTLLVEACATLIAVIRLLAQPAGRSLWSMVSLGTSGGFILLVCVWAGSLLARTLASVGEHLTWTD